MSEIIQVKYVNQPKDGKPKGSIKTPDGRMFNVWPDKLSQFTPGKSYEIEYDAWKADNGKVFNTITKIKPVNGSSAPAPASNGNGASDKDGYWERKEARDIAKEPRITRMATLNSAIAYARILADSSGQVPATTDLFRLATEFQAFIDQAGIAKVAKPQPQPEKEPEPAETGTDDSFAL